MIKAIVVILYINIVGYSIIDKFQNWIGRSDLPALISKVEHDYLEIFIFQYIWNEVYIKTNTVITSMLKTKKRE